MKFAVDVTNEMDAVCLIFLGLGTGSENLGTFGRGAPVVTNTSD
jgi:hypothetical protein